MTAMLERAAMAACDYISSNDPEFMAWEKLSDENKREYEGLVRAVLMAVRDLDRDIVTEAKKATVDTSGNMADFLGAPDWQVSGSFARSIDAILSETP